MELTKTQTIAFILAVVLVCGLVASIVKSTRTAYGAAPSGLIATVASTSQSAVSATAITLFATSTCTSRTISTLGAPIMLTFSDITGQTPTASLGFVQGASTTVTYDAELYGCGRVRAYSFGSQSITISENK